jgi:non-ribosomal peptide synthetase component F
LNLEPFPRHQTNLKPFKETNTVADLQPRIAALSPQKRKAFEALLVARKAAHAEKCVHEMFEEQVERRREETAVVWEGRHVSYEGLNKRANQLARYLAEM